ncbi:hypothetical protein JOH51_007184 [Rhizobium leguminosarum]|nr:hypothetical protein [Rhizobium leguminosarum]
MISGATGFLIGDAETVGSTVTVAKSIGIPGAGRTTCPGAIVLQVDRWFGFNLLLCHLIYHRAGPKALRNDRAFTQSGQCR